VPLKIGYSELITLGQKIRNFFLVFNDSKKAQKSGQIKKKKKNQKLFLFDNFLEARPGQKSFEII
jgi:hypothetical protein